VTRKRRNELGWPAGFRWIRAVSEADEYLERTPLYGGEGFDIAKIFVCATRAV